MAKNSWSIEELQDAIQKNKRWKNVCIALGIVNCTNTIRRIKRASDKNGIDYSHFEWKRKYTQEDLIKVVPDCISFREVLVKLGMNATGSAYPFIQKAIKDLGIDTSHFKGMGWKKGKKGEPTNPPKPLEEILIENSQNTNYTRLKERLIKGCLLKNICSVCGQEPFWNNKPLVLELDHINGVKSDNRIENLRIICPHCHSQTPTFCRGKIKSIKQKCLVCNISVNKQSKSGMCQECYEIMGHKNQKKDHSCVSCGGLAVKNSKSKLCRTCYDKTTRKVERPSKEELEQLMKNMSMVKLGQKYGVSDNAVRKWAKSYEIL